jgi:hypothetical protein
MNRRRGIIGKVLFVSLAFIALLIWIGSREPNSGSSPRTPAANQREPIAEPLPPPSPQPSASAAPAKEPEPELPAGYDPAKAPQREQFMHDLMKAGLLKSVRMHASGLGADAVVGRPFAHLDYSDKQKFASAIYCWCLDENKKCLSVDLIDPVTNKKLGDYTGYGGLSWN